MAETYSYDTKTGLLLTQQVKQGATTRLDLKYNYTTTNDANNIGPKTGQLTGVTDLTPGQQSRGKAYVYDKLGRLKEARGGSDAFNNPTWTQAYSYDRYGNRTGVAKSGPGAGSVPLDGLASLGFNTASNRISGYDYDHAGNLTRGQTDNGVWLRYKYDAAGRLAQVMNDSSVAQETYSYGASNKRLKTVYGNGLGAPATYYGWDGGQVITEYRDGMSSNLVWEKHYVYLGGRLLATTDINGTKYHHPDRLGTRLVTDGATGTVLTEQANLPFGTALTGESSGAISNRRFTSYDRSGTTGMDYAVNRFYSAAQGRFTQVDPIGMGAASLSDPQTLNLYSYCGNDPINHVDPDGLFFKKLFGWIGKAFKWAFRIAAVIVAVIAVMAAAAIGQYWGSLLITKGIVALLFGSAGLLATAGWAPGKIGQIAGALITAGLSWGSNFRTPSTFPNGSGVSGVSHFIQDKEIKAGPKEDTRWYRLLFEWALGIGPDHRQFGPDSKMTQDIRTSPDIDRHRARYCRAGQANYKGSFRFGLIGWAKGADWPFHTNAADGLLRSHIHMGRQFVGSFELSITRTSDGGAVFSAYNETSIESLLAGFPFKVSRGGSILNLPGSTTSQTYWWKEANRWSTRIELIGLVRPQSTTM